MWTFCETLLKKWMRFSFSKVKKMKLWLKKRIRFSFFKVKKMKLCLKKWIKFSISKVKKMKLCLKKWMRFSFSKLSKMNFFLYYLMIFGTRIVYFWVPNCLFLGSKLFIFGIQIVNFWDPAKTAFLGPKMNRFWNPKVLQPFLINYFSSELSLCKKLQTQLSCDFFKNV